MAGYDWRKAVIDYNDNRLISDGKIYTPDTEWTPLKADGDSCFNEVALDAMMCAAEAGILPNRLHEIFASEEDFDDFCEGLSQNPFRVVYDRVFVAIWDLIPQWTDGDQEYENFSNAAIAAMFRQVWEEENEE